MIKLPLSGVEPPQRKIRSSAIPTIETRKLKTCRVLDILFWFSFFKFQFSNSLSPSSVTPGKGRKWCTNTPKRWNRRRKAEIRRFSSLFTFGSSRIFKKFMSVLKIIRNRPWLTSLSITETRTSAMKVWWLEIII